MSSTPLRSFTFLNVFFLYTTFVTSLNLPQPLTLSNHSLDSLVIPNITSSSPNASLSLAHPKVDYDCSGGEDYGDSINFMSCSDAALGLLEEFQSTSDTVLSFMDRRGKGEGQISANVALPHLSLSRTATSQANQ